MPRDIGNYLTQITQFVDYLCRIYYRHSQPEDREDIANEVALIAHENRHKVVERTETEFLGWLHEIAKNVIWNWSRREGTIQRTSLGSLSDEGLNDDLIRDRPSTSQAPETDVLAQERLEAVRDAILELPLIHQQVVWLFYIEELPEKKIAKRLGIRKGTVKSRLYHARKQLVTQLESYFAAS